MDERLDFGEVAGLRIDVISETGWFDDAIFKKNMADSACLVPVQIQDCPIVVGRPVR